MLTLNMDDLWVMMESTINPEYEEDIGPKRKFDLSELKEDEYYQFESPVRRRNMFEINFVMNSDLH